MQQSLNTKHLVIIALCALVSGLMHGPINSVLPALYAEEFGLNLAVLGSLLLAARLFDAVSDPMIGLLSDRTQSRFGKRKPWILPGAILVSIAGYFLFNPHAGAGAFYFLFFFMLIYLAWTIQEIPFGAWMLELSRDTSDRAKINGYRGVGVLIGTVLFTLAPTIIPGAGGEMSFHVLSIIAIAMILIVPLSSVALVKYVPQGDVIDQEDRPTLKEMWRALTSNKPFVAFVIAYLFLGLHYGFFWSLAFIFMDAYLGIGNRYTEVFLPFFLMAPIAIPCWVFLMKRVGKYRVVASAYSATLFILPLPWFITPGEHAFSLLLGYFIISGFFYPLFMVPMPTILGDIIDHDEIKTGKNRSAQYLAVLTFLAKTTQAFGISLGLILVGLSGFELGAETQSDEGVLGLRIVYSFFPALTLLPGVILLWRFPINDRNQKDIADGIARLRQSRQTEEVAAS